MKSSRPEVFCKKGVLRNFAEFTRKHFVLENFAKFLRKPFVRNICERLLLTLHRTINIVPAGICMLKVNNRNTRTRCEIC